MLTDPIANFLNQLRNTSHARKRELIVRSSGIIKAMADVLMQKRFIETMEEMKSDKIQELKIVLRKDREPLEVKRVSKPGQRIYVGYQGLKRVRNGLGIALISTSQGVLSNEEARQKKIGGEYLCEVY